MTEVDLNSDMGEGFGPWTIGDGVDAAIMPLISSANIATGFHAGDPSSMRRTVEMAAEHGVAIGVHPGFRDLVGFGRRHIAAPAIELVNDMLYQLGALREFARLQGLSLQHVNTSSPARCTYMHLARDEAARCSSRPCNAWNRNFCSIACPVRPPGASVGNWASRWCASSTPTATTTAAAPSSSPGGSPPSIRNRSPTRSCAPAARARCAPSRRGPRHRLRLGVHPQRHPGALELVASTRARLEGAGIRIKAPR